MKTGRTPYKDISDTLRKLKIQVIDSLPYAKTLPTFADPQTLFYYLKARTKYKNDPPGVELLQTLQTLLEGAYWGIPGAGDCDCFVIATLALCWAQGKEFQNVRVVIAGRSKDAPVHIWSTIDFQGETYALDLTNPTFNHERDYKYTQRLKFNI